MKNRSLVKDVGTIVMILACGFLFLRYSFFSLTGSWFSETIDEPLNSPVEVTKITSGGVMLADGKIIPIPGVDQMPIDLRVLEDAVLGGVEISLDGEIYGRLRIHHWCGNDPVRNHYARINLTDLIWTYESLEARRKERFYGKYGLNITHYGTLSYERFERAYEGRTSRGY